MYDSSTWGVIKLTLKQSGYDWQFVPISGGTFTDAGSGSVHDAPPAGDHALDLGSSNAYVTFGDPDKLDLGTFTVETWFRRDGDRDGGHDGHERDQHDPAGHPRSPQADGSNVDANWLLGHQCDDQDTDRRRLRGHGQRLQSPRVRARP